MTLFPYDEALVEEAATNLRLRKPNKAALHVIAEGLRWCSA